MSKLSWLLRVVAAGILVQTLFFKFSGAPESVHIFSTLGAEPVGRILSGVLEPAIAVVLLVPALHVLGALLASAVMLGAMQGDGGLLFALAWTVLLCSLGTLALFQQGERQVLKGATL